MDESRLKGHTLLCCFLDFIKAFDMVPKGGLWAWMQTLGVPLQLRVGISRIYEKVLCRLKQSHGMSSTFQSNMGVKQGCPLSPTLFGICIDRLEEMIAERVSMDP